jgi:hypothetical protein
MKQPPARLFEGIASSNHARRLPAQNVNEAQSLGHEIHALMQNANDVDALDAFGGKAIEEDV